MSALKRDGVSKQTDFGVKKYFMEPRTLKPSPDVSGSFRQRPLSVKKPYDK